MAALRPVAVTSLLAFLIALPLAVADHHQSENGGLPTTGDSWIVFDHKGGNEWWVEVKVTTSDFPPDAVYARSEKGTFHPLTLRSWGNWAGSFHIPPGEKVQFNAVKAGSMSDIWNVNSCLFTHPAGVESCPAGVTDDFHATWTPSGNANWEQVYINGNRPVASAGMIIDDVNGGRLYWLKHESWGAWTSSASAPQGYTVQFGANDGAQGAESPCYRWTTATVTECPPSYGPNAAAPWMTRFDDWKGNEWWIEAKVGPVQPVRVWAQDDGQSWVPLQWHADWGTWAGSFHIEPGHKVQLKAEFGTDYPGDGHTYTSCWFTHPGGFAPDGNQICRNLEYPA